MKKLVIITDNYPFIRGEMPFLLPELAQTSSLFQVEILCKSLQPVQQFQTPYQIPVTHYVPVYTKADRIKNLLACFTDIHYYKNVFGKDHASGSWKVRASTVRTFRLAAKKFHAYLKQNGYFDDAEQTVFYSYWYNYAVLALSYEKKHQPLTIITRAHGYDLYNERANGGRQPYKDLMDKYINKAFFVSKAGREYYLNHFAGKDASSYQMAHLGVPDNGLNPVVQDNTVHLFSCSNLIPLKRVHLIIEALASIDNLHVSWVHAGAGTLDEKLQEQAEQELGEKKNITYCFLGSVKNETVIDYYKKNPLDLFITASQTEGVPVSIMEALSFGVPVIGTNVGGIPEEVNADTGFLLSANPEPKEIANAIRQYASLSLSEKNRLRENARRLWETSFNDKINYADFAQKLAQLSS